MASYALSRTYSTMLRAIEAALDIKLSGYLWLSSSVLVGRRQYATGRESIDIKGI